MDNEFENDKRIGFVLNMLIMLTMMTVAGFVVVGVDIWMNGRPVASAVETCKAPELPVLDDITNKPGRMILSQLGDGDTLEMIRSPNAVAIEVRHLGGLRGLVVNLDTKLRIATLPSRPPAGFKIGGL